MRNTSISSKTRYMKIFTFFNRCIITFVISLFTIISAFGQRNYATTQRPGSAGILCVGCSVTNPANAVDGNTQTFSTVNVSVGLGSQTWQELIFPGAAKVAANTPATVKLGSGDNLLNVTLLGGVLLQAYNGNSAIGQPVAASTLISALNSNNQTLVTLTPNQTYDRIRVTLDGGLLGLVSTIYVYDSYYNGTGNAACNTAVDELHGISSALLGLGLNVGGIANPQNAIDGDINTASTLNAGVGLVGAYAQQTVIFNNTSVQGDSVKLTFSLPQALIDAGVLANISVQTYNGNTSNNDAQNLSGGLLTVRLLDLNGTRRKVTVTYAPTSVFDRVQVRLGGGVASALSTLDLYEAQRVIPSPVIKYNNIVTNSAQICTGGAATLIANAVPNTVFNWYTVPTGGAPVFTGASFTTPALIATTTYYVEAVRNGCTDASARTAVVVNVNTIPTAPVVTNPNVTVCQGQPATFAVQNIPGITINWYAAATGGTPLFTGDTYTTGALNATTTYYAEATSGGGQCISPTRTAVTATVSAPPATPTLTAPAVTICDGNLAVLSVASPVAGVVYNWYSAATGGTLLYTGATFTSPVLHNNTNYYVEAVNASGCSSAARAQGTVTVTAKPTNPVLMAGSTTIAAGQTATITVSNNETGVTYNWYTSAAAATPVFSGVTYTTPALYSNTTYYVGAVNATGCQSANRTAITINVTINTNAPCAFANTQSTNIGGICVGCSVDNGALAVDADTTTASTLHLLVGVTGFAEQELRFQQPGFAGDTIKLGLQSPVGLADVGLLGSIQVTLYNGATPAGTYTLDNNLLTLRLLGANKYAVYIPATAAYDRITVRLTGTASALNALSIYYAIQQFAKPVFNPTAPEVCKGSTAQINITSPANGGTFGWFAAPTGGTAITTGTSFTTPVLNANATYYVEYTRNGCVSPVRYAVNVLVNDIPLKPTVPVSDITINSGQTATVTANAANGATVKWYDVPTGGVTLATGNNYTSPALTADKTFYAESSLGTCTSVDRTPVNVHVTAVVIPDVTVTPPIIAVNRGTTATFTASSTTPGSIFNWYTAPTGGTTIYTGANFTSPPLFANTTYYAEATVQATGAKSAARATGIATVNSVTTNATPCDAAIDQTTDINGLLCLGCAVNNAAAAVDADRNTFSQLSVPVGLLNAYAQQTLRFAGTGRAGDSVVVELGTPASLADVTVLSGISLATYNGATYNNDRFSVNGGLLNITLLSGQNRFRVAFKATADFDRVEIRLNSTVGVLNSLNVYDAYQEVAAPVIATPSVTACAGSQATLTATVPSYVTVKWYTTPAGGTPVFTGAVFTTPVLNATTTYYAEATRTGYGCAQAVRTPATVTVTPLPDAPVVAVPTVTTCAGQPATFTTTVVPGVTYNWYAAATGGTSLFTGANFTTPALNATTSYYVEASNGACANSTRTQVTANVSTTVNDPTVAQTTVATCSGTPATLTATSTQPGVTFKWYTVATGGTPVFTGAQYTTPALTANISYYVEASTGTCVSTNRVKVDVTVNPAPAEPTVVTVPANGQVTSGQTATINASSTTAGATFNWYTAATGGTPIFTGTSFTTPVLTSTTTYYVESASATCASARTQATITVVPVFSTACDIASTQVPDVNGGVLCVLCAVNNPNNSVDADQTNYSTLSIPVGLVGSYVAQRLVFTETGTVGDSISVKLHFPAALLSVGALDNIRIGSYNGATYNNDGVFLNSGLLHVQLLAGGQDAIIKFAPGATFNAVEIRLNGALASVLNSVDVGYASKQVEAPQLAVNTKNICAGTTATFNVSNARAGVTYTWYDAPTGGTVVGTGATFTTPVLNATTTYYVQSSRTANACPNPNRVAATANVTPSPLPPVLAQNTAQLCAGDNIILSVTNVGTNTVNWYDAATGGNLVHTGATFQVTPIVSVVYYAELTNGTCTSPSRATATITVNPRPAKPGVESTNVTVCIGSPAVLRVLTPEAGVTYDWYDAATAGTKVGSGTTFTTPAILANTSYYVQATGAGGCTNNGGRTQVNVNTNGQIANPTLSATTTQVCSGGSASISVVNPIVGIQYNWYNAATGGTLVYTGTTLTINNVTANASYFVEASNSAGCLSASRTRTDITVLPIPTPPTIQANSGSLSVCMGASASLSIVNPQADQVYRWYSAATGGTLLFTGTQFNTPGLTGTTTYYVEASTAGNCNPSTRTSVTVTVNALPTDPVLTAASVQVCAGSPATFSIASPQAGVRYQWFNSPAQTTKLFEGNTFVTGPITTNTMFYVSAVNASGCTSTNLTSAQATVTAPPPAPIVANGNTVQTCAGTQVTLSIANPQPGFVYNWYNAATGGTLITTGPTFTTSALSASVTYYAEAVNNVGCTSLSRTQVAITVNPLPVAPVVTAQGGSTTPTICSGNTVTLTATSTTANVTFNWYNAATGGSMVFTGATFTTAPLSANIIYYVEAVSNTSGCASLTRTAIAITVVAPPATPTPISATVNVCSGSPATLGVSSPVLGLTYKWYSDAARTNLLFTGPTYVTGPQTVNTTYYLEATNGSCASSTATSVQVNVSALPGAPAVVNANMAGCPGSQVILAISNPTAGFTYNWYAAATGGASLASGTTFTTPALVGNVTYYAEAVNASGCASTTRTPVTVTVSAAPAAPQVATTGTDICAGSNTTISATNVDPAVTIKWYAASTGGVALGTGTTFTTPVLNANTTYFAEAVSNAAGCASSTRTPVAITVRQPLTAPTVTVANTTTSSITFQWNAVNGATSYQISTNGGASFVTPSSGATGTTHTITGLAVNTSVTIIVRANGGSACQLSANSNAVTGSTTNPFGNDIWVPNAFTPNGDGNNDILYVYGTNIKSVTFSVYDQYGELLFRSPSQANGWDGTYKGAKQPVAVYVYYVDAVMGDGQIVQKKGSVTLLR
jgi:gliding motility-associated-like protein